MRWPRVVVVEGVGLARVGAARRGRPWTVRMLSIAAALGALACCLLAASAPARGATTKPRLLPAAIDARHVVRYGSRRALLYSSKGITRLNPNGAIDRSFGEQGWVHVFANAVRVLPSGKIVVLTAGSLERLLPSGRVDRSFGNRGVAPVDFGYAQESVQSMTLIGESIVVSGVGGESIDPRTGEIDGQAITMKFKPGGAVDRRFGDGGQVVGAAAETLQTTPGGKILGSSRAQYFSEMNADGSLVTSFGEDGFAKATLWEGPELGEAFLSHQPPVVLPNGAFLLVGTVSKFAGGLIRYAVATSRYGPRGRLDTSYGNNGVVATPFRGSTFVEGAALRPDGDLLVAFTRAAPPEASSRVMGVLALNRNGGLDESIPGGAQRTVAFGDSTWAEAVVPQPSNQAWLFGFTRGRNGGPAGKLVARFNLGPHRHRRGGHHR